MTLLARALSVTIPITILSRWETFTKGAVPVLILGGCAVGSRSLWPCPCRTLNTRPPF